MPINWQTAIRRVPMWQTQTMAAYRSIFEPYTPKWDYDDYRTRCRVPLWDIHNGCILWLPPRDKINPATLQGSGRETAPPKAFDRPVLCVEVDVRGPTSGQVYFTCMGSFSDTGGPEAFLREPKTNPISPWVRRPWVDTVLPIVRSDACHDYPAALTLEDDAWRTEAIGLPKNAAVLTGYGIYAIDYKELRCYNQRVGGRLLRKVGKLADDCRYRLDERSMRIVNHILGLRQLPWVKSGTGMWDNFIEQVGIGTPMQLEAIKEARRFGEFLETIPQEQRDRLYKYNPGKERVPHNT